MNAWPRCIAARTLWSGLALLVWNTGLQAQEPYYDAERDVMVTPPRPLSPYAEPVPGAPVVQMFEFLVRGGQVLRGPGSIAVDHGATVTFVIESDTADALRVEGYGFDVDLIPDKPVLLKFTAQQPGRFALRLARSGRVLGTLEVGPPRAQGPG